MPKTVESWLADIILYSGKTSRESSSVAPNSFGAGYDQGRYDAFLEVAEKMRELLGSRPAGQG